MSIRVTCQKCGVVLKVKEELGGTKCKCPACKGSLYVPTVEEAAAQAAGAPLGATETSAAASAGDTGAIKVPTKTKPPKVAAASDQPPPEANGSAASHAPAKEAPPPRMEAPPPAAPAPPTESSTDDLDEPNGEAPPKAGGKARLTMPEAEEEAAPKVEKPKAEPKQKLRMSDTDAEDAAPPAEKPKAEAAPKPKPDAKPAGKGDEFDLDSFLMEGPKPKALPPAPDETKDKKGPAPRPGSGRRLSMSDDETNVPGPSETLPPPNKGRGSAAESAMAALGGGSGTASSAKDLLARASQEGRARAAQMPDEERAGFDFKGAFKAIYQQYGLQTIGTIVLCAVLYFGMDYMMGTSLDLPPLARVYGKVTLKGEAVEGIVVKFTAIGSKDSKDDESKVKGPVRPATAVTDKDGYYDLMYMEGIRGAVVGHNRVWIDPVSPENSKKIPGQWFNAATSGDIREVKATGGEENIELSKGK